VARRIVALHLPPDRFAEQLRTVWDAGDAALPLPLDAPEEHLHRLLDRCRPHVLVAWSPTTATSERRHLDAARPIPDDTALVLTTSGTTGQPKEVRLSRGALAASTRASVHRLGAAAGDRFALALPLHHIAGLQVLLRAWWCGTEPLPVTALGEPNSIATTPGEHISLVPTQLRRLVDLHERGECAPTALSRWRSILVGGAHLDRRLLERAHAAGANVVTSYGMTETCGGCVYDGLPLEDVEVALDPDGRIRIRGPVLFSGYLDDPPGTVPLEDGWFRTGDLGEFRDGRLAVLGRHDDVIVSGGENVSAQSVTEVLMQHPDVADAAVVGMPDPEWGQRVVAVVVAGGGTPPSLEELRHHVGLRLPPSHVPRQLVLTERLPRDGLGKPTTPALRGMVEGHRGAGQDS
jgi:o-succinylbenzoate---CoA ligase